MAPEALQTRNNSRRIGAGGAGRYRRRRHAGLHVEHARGARPVGARARPRARRPRQRRRLLLAERRRRRVGGEVAASLVGYRLDDPYDLGGLAEIARDRPAAGQLEAKAPGSWYVNVLATFPEFRGLGIAPTCSTSPRTRPRRGSFRVERDRRSWNEDAARLYRRAGYEAVVPNPPFCSRMPPRGRLGADGKVARNGDGELRPQ